jgi:DNA-directed RNA polymerase specialized sigma24 family protein
MSVMLSPHEVERLRARLEEPYETGPKLNLEQRRQLVLDYINGASKAEVARRFGITPQSAAYHIRRALQIAQAQAQ